MRPMTRMFVFAAALASTSAAFAISKVTVNVPFNFESHGKTYQAGRYDVTLNQNESVITLSNHNHPGQTIMWMAFATEFGPDAPTHVDEIRRCDRRHASTSQRSYCDEDHTSTGRT